MHKQRLPPMASVSIVHILECVGPSPGLIESLIDRILLIIPGYINDIEKAISQGDAGALQRTSHTLKGSLSYLGSEKALTLLHALEQAGKDNRLTDAPPLLETFKVELDRILSYLRSGEWKKEISQVPG